MLPRVCSGLSTRATTTLTCAAGTLLAASARARGAGSGVACAAATGTFGIFACLPGLACTGALASSARLSTDAPHASDDANARVDGGGNHDGDEGNDWGGKGGRGEEEGGEEEGDEAEGDEEEGGNGERAGANGATTRRRGKRCRRGTRMTGDVLQCCTLRNRMDLRRSGTAVRTRRRSDVASAAPRCASDMRGAWLAAL